MRMAVVGQRCGARLAAVDMPFGAAAVEVDKPEDLRLVEERLRGEPAGVEGSAPSLTS